MKDCENCGLPAILYKGVCTRGGQVTSDDVVKIWRKFKEKRNPSQIQCKDKASRGMIRAEVAKEVERTRGIPQEHNSMNDLAILTNHLKIMAEMQIRKETQTVEPVQTLAQLVKPLKPALWTKDMSRETYGTQIEN